MVDRPTWTFDDHNYIIKGPQNLTAIHTLAKPLKLLPRLPSTGGQGQINPPSWSRAQDHGGYKESSAICTLFKDLFRQGLGPALTRAIPCQWSRGKNTLGPLIRWLQLSDLANVGQ